MSLTLAALALVGTAAQISAERNRAQATQRQLEAEQEARNLQAIEMLRRFEINKVRALTDAEKLRQRQIGAFLKGGVDIGTGTPLTVLEATTSQVLEDILLQQEEVNFKVNQLERGIDATDQLIGDTASASRLNQFGLFFQGAAQAGSLAVRGGNTQRNRGRSPAVVGGAEF